MPSLTGLGISLPFPGTAVPGYSLFRPRSTSSGQALRDWRSMCRSRERQSSKARAVHLAERKRRISRITRSPWSVWKRCCAWADPSTMINSFGSGAFSYCARIPGSLGSPPLVSSRATMNSERTLSFSALPVGAEPRNTSRSISPGSDLMEASAAA
jgi:hypothetical protein